VKYLLTKIKNGEGKKEYLDMIKDISYTTEKAARCGLGQASGNLIKSAISKFEDEFNLFIKKGCDYND